MGLNNSKENIQQNKIRFWWFKNEKLGRNNFYNVKLDKIIYEIESKNMDIIIDDDIRIQNIVDYGISMLKFKEIQNNKARIYLNDDYIGTINKNMVRNIENKIIMLKDSDEPSNILNLCFREYCSNNNALTI